MTNDSERYEVERLYPEGEERKSFNDLDAAMVEFYENVAAYYDEPSVSVYVHDLVDGRTLANWIYDPDADYGKVIYDPPTSPEQRG